MTKGSKRRAKKPAARPARPSGPARAGGPPGARRPARAVGRFRNLGFVAALVAAVIAAIALIGVANLLKGDDNPANTNPIVIPDHTAPADGAALGTADAPVTIYEYSDFQCPYCRDVAAELVPRLDTDYLATGKARLIFKNLAFLGQESVWAAEAAACAREQGKFWEYHNKLFEEQDGENKGTFKADNLKRFAQEIGLDEAAFNTCFDEGKYKAEVVDEREEGQRRGVNATPSFFVGQTEVDNTYEAISKAIDGELATATPESESTPQPEGTPSG